MIQAPANYDLAEVFFELAELTVLDSPKNGGFKAKAYDKAAWRLLEIPERITSLTIAELTEIDGIGKSIASKIREYSDTGSIEKLDDLRTAFPVDKVMLSRMSGLGPSKLKILEDLGVETLEALQASLTDGSISEHKDFGPKGQLRLQHQLGQRPSERVFTVSEAISEAKAMYARYGVDSPIKFASESNAGRLDDFTDRLVLVGVKPEDLGDCACSHRYEIPIEFQDATSKIDPLVLHGDLHFHTDASGDGKSSLLAMVDAAVARGISYIAITDHAEDLRINGLSKSEMLENRERIQDLDRTRDDVDLFFGAELNIAADGSVDYDTSFREGFDYTVASVHSHFDLSEQDQTKRLVAAIADPTVNAIGHLSGRKVGRRAGIQFDVDIVVEALVKFDTALEINASLDRLDATKEVVAHAKSRGVRLVINSDSHHVSDLERVVYGSYLAGTLGLSTEEVLNANPVEDFRAWLGI